MDEDLTFLASTHNPHCTIVIDKHLVGYYTMQLMTEGTLFLSYDQQEYQLSGAWFWPAYPGPRIRFHAADGTSHWFHRHIGFLGPRVNQWIAAGLWPTAPQPAPPEQDYGAFFDKLIQLSQRTDRWGKLRAINKLDQLLLELVEVRTQAPSHAAWFEHILRQLRDTEHFVPDYEHIAAEVGMSVSTLRRRFKQTMGTTMHSYVMQHRITAAQRLLVNTEWPLHAIAAELGYNDVYFFARQFRAVTGVSPGTYRSSRQK
ncbi:MAG: helix-turn-helix transcriptional regulator [Chloroflexota bacterium]